MRRGMRVVDITPAFLMTLEPAEMQARAAGESSATVARRVEAAARRQQARQGQANSALGPREIDTYCEPDEGGRKLLAQATERLRLSARGYHRVLKVARTIADLAGAEQVGAAHLAEAIQYRRGLDARV